MDFKIFVALTTASVSIVVALLSLATAWMTSRSSAKAARSLEQLKHSLQRSADTRRLADEDLTKSVDSIKASMRALQIVKDEIQLILSSSAESLGADERASRLATARDHLIDAYQEHHPNLDHDEANALHSAKNTVFDIEQQIPNESHEKLAETRHRLTEAQNTLRDALTDRILKRTVCIETT